MSFLFKEVEVKYFDRAKEDQLVDMAFSFGALGSKELLSFKQDSRDEDYGKPQILGKPSLDIAFYFEDEPPDEFFEQIKIIDSRAQFRCYSKIKRDWLEEWKKGYEPFELVPGIKVVPKWLKQGSLNKKTEIVMEPGMAFGTGTHETTKLCAQLLARGVDSGVFTQKSMLDVGCGTGILSILGHRLGFKKITAVDNDEEALRVAAENCESNGCGDITFYSDIKNVSHKFEVVVANIIEGVLLKLRADILAHLQAGGFLIVSGVLQDSSVQFLKEFMSKDMILEDQLVQGEWVAFLIINGKTMSH